MNYLLNKFIFLLFLCLSLIVVFRPDGLSQNIKLRGKIDFYSKAPQEEIKAISDKLHGLINLHENSFAFVVDINSFDGFNNPLQKIHFNENYMESGLYPQAKFYGKIIDQINYDVVEDEIIRVKGNFDIHGTIQERILTVRIFRKNGILHFDSEFFISLEDFKISVPRIVHQKLSTEIKVHVKGRFSK